MYQQSGISITIDIGCTFAELDCTGTIYEFTQTIVIDFLHSWDL